MNPKYDIDTETIKRTSCGNEYKCLHEYLPICGQTPIGIEGVVCDKDCKDCMYQFGKSLDNPICMCWVRQEIYDKYKK